MLPVRATRLRPWNAPNSRESPQPRLCGAEHRPPESERPVIQMRLATRRNARSMTGMRIGSVVFNGRSGEKYCFEVWPVETRFKPAAAVYFVTKRELTAGVFTRAGH